MKFVAALLSLVGVASAAKMVELKDVKANSDLGQSLLSKARKLEQNDEEVDFTWVADFSIKFQGCHHISQWNEEANGEEDVRIQTKRLVRFRLCPSDSCSTTSGAGCKSGYGDYIIDMESYLGAYVQSVNNFNEMKCEELEQEGGACECGNDNGDDGFDEDICKYDCFKQYGMEEVCMDQNPYEDDEAQGMEKFELEQFVECAQVDFPEDENNRKLEEGEEEEVEYFMAPYCASQGGAIYMGLFTDDACTIFADDYGGKSTYKTMSKGEDLPFGEVSVVDMDCISCMEPQEEDENNNGDDAADEDMVAEVCEEIYAKAGKCESNLGIDDPNENACNYMEGIKIVRSNGTLQPASSKANKTASVFIGIFVVAFVLLAAYVYYLKTKLDRASINLSE